MWGNRDAGNSPAPVKGFFTPPATRKSSPPKTWHSEKIIKNNNNLFHVVHKVPAGDSPYVKAKHVQLIEKDPGRAVSLFWSAINAGDRVDSALKDMAVVMKQLNRSEEAIEAIKSFRHLCSQDSQESLDNVLVELYKSSGRPEDQIQILQQKLKSIEDGNAFGGRRVKPARSQGKKVQITVEQEYARILGNLAWAYLQLNDFKAAEEHYRKALSIEFDRNKQCNLAICLMNMNKITEAKFLLQTIRTSTPKGQMDESYAKSFERASQLLAEIESQSSSSEHDKENLSQSGNFTAFSPHKKPHEPFRSNGGHCSWNTSYTPQVPARVGYLRTPFTQPRRGYMGLDGKNWKKETNTNEPVSCFNRRLQFEGYEDSKLLPSRDPERKCSENQQNRSPNISAENTPSKGLCDGTITDAKRQENLSSTDDQNAGNNGYLRTPFTQPRGGSMGLDSKNWKKETNTNEPVNCFNRRLQFEGYEDSKLPPSRDPERKCSEYQQNRSPNVSAENAPSKGLCDRTITDAKRQENLSSTDDRNAGNNEEDIPIYKGNKKSWADLVEEDEEESMKDLLGSSFWKTFT